MNQICKNCATGFEIEDFDKEFYAKINVPEPQTCPDCRNRARLVFRNERFYYQRSCDFCKKNIISVYDPKHTPNVYCNACWWSDKWDPTQYGRDFDFSKPFFSQYQALLREVPKLAMQNDNSAGSENCEYTYDFAYSKNAYLVIGSWHVQDCMYGFQINFVKDCIDNYRLNDSQLMYQCVLCERSYGCQECTQCQSCNNCIFGFDLKDCKDCIASAGLRHKQYYIFNKSYSKEDFLQKKKELEFGSWSKRESLRQEFEKFLLTIPRKYANLVNCEDCTGDNLLNSKNSYECYEHRNLHSCKWMSAGDSAKDCFECYSTGGPELCYQSITPDNSYNAAFTVYCWKSQNVWYSENCHSSHDIFGSVSLKRKSFCILNKAYEQNEYEKLKIKIIEHMKQPAKINSSILRAHGASAKQVSNLALPVANEAELIQWGEFFSAAVSPFAYNETIAQEWFPLEKTSALERGYRWQDQLPGTFGKQTVSWDQIPDSIEDADKKICAEVFACLSCGKSFKILEREFLFYANGGIPLPRRCIDCRHYARKNRINPQKLWQSNCAKCSATIQTTYAPQRPEKVLCEKCYLAEVY